MSYAPVGAGFSFEASASTEGGGRLKASSSAPPSVQVETDTQVQQTTAQPAYSPTTTTGLWSKIASIMQEAPPPAKPSAFVLPVQSKPSAFVLPTFYAAAVPVPRPGMASNRKWLLWGGLALVAGVAVVWVLKRKPAKVINPALKGGAL